MASTLKRMAPDNIRWCEWLAPPQQTMQGCEVHAADTAKCSAQPCGMQARTLHQRDGEVEITPKLPIYSEL